MRTLVILLAFAGILLCQDAKPAPPAAAPVPPPSLSQVEQLSLANAQLNQEIASLRQQLANATKELIYTKACARNNFPVDRCLIQPDGTLMLAAPEPPPAEVKPPAK